MIPRLFHKVRSQSGDWRWCRRCEREAPIVSHKDSAKALSKQKTIDPVEKQMHLLLAVEAYQQRMIMNNSNLHGAYECHTSDECVLRTSHHESENQKIVEPSKR